MSRTDLWNPPLAAVLAELRATPQGLAEAEAADRLRRFGPNDATARRARPLWLRFLSRFVNPLVLILLFASALSASTGDVTSFVIIVVIVLSSVVLDFVQEVRAENAVDALRRSVGLRATVRRDGAEAECRSTALVPGDVVRAWRGRPRAGRRPAARGARPVRQPGAADRRALPGGEASLTCRTGREPAAATNAVFMGTSVISGTAAALVCRTGAATALGGLAGTLAAQRAAGRVRVGMRRFGLLILRLTMFLVLFVLVVNVLFHRPWLESLLFALALAVGLTPELLPMVVTVTLARGARRLAARRVIVKRLAAIHDLGAHGRAVHRQDRAR